MLTCDEYVVWILRPRHSCDLCKKSTHPIPATPRHNLIPTFKTSPTPSHSNSPIQSFQIFPSHPSNPSIPHIKPKSTPSNLPIIVPKCQPPQQCAQPASSKSINHTPSTQFPSPNHKDQISSSKWAPRPFVIPMHLLWTGVGRCVNPVRDLMRGRGRLPSWDLRRRDISRLVIEWDCIVFIMFAV